MNSSALNKLSIRKASLSDLMLYYHWANDPVVRSTSFHTEKISLEEHESWFRKKLNDKDSYMFVIEEDSHAVGQVRFEVNENAVISVSIDKNFRGRGLAADVLTKAVEAFRKERNNAIYAYIRPENGASEKAFKKAGFKFHGDDMVNDIKCRLYIKR